MKALQVPPPQSASVLQLGTLEQPQGQKPWNFLLTTVERPPSSHSGRDAADAAETAGAGEAKAGGTFSLQDGVSGEATGAATPATAGCEASPARPAWIRSSPAGSSSPT